MGRLIQEYVKKPLAEELLFGRLADGGLVSVDLDKEGGKLTFRYPEAGKPKPKGKKGGGSGGGSGGRRAKPKMPELVE